MKNNLIKNTERDRVDLASKMYESNDSETETHRLLTFVDIIAAIDYYGITELLDTIGEESMRAHLEMDGPHQVDQSTSLYDPN